MPRMNMRTFYVDGVLSLQRYFIKLYGYIAKIICQRGNTIRMQIGKFRFLIALEIDPNFDIMRMYRFQRYMFEFRQAVLHTSFYIKIVYQEGDINSKILILLLLFLRFAFKIESVS